MAKARKTIGLTYNDLISPVFIALQALGGSGTVKEINDKIIESLKLPDTVVDVLHDPNRSPQTELEYQLAWARTYLKKYGAIENCSKGVWAITSEFLSIKNVDAKDVLKKATSVKKDEISTVQEIPEIGVIDDPEEIQPWKVKLIEILHNMDPWGFERLAQRLLRECGFTQVQVTKKTGDGGIDGTGKLKINGIFSFNVAFQCKRYKGSVSAGDIRDFRGSLATNIEKGVFITTGSFTKAARDEASEQGKQQIDLIDGDEFMNKLAEYSIGLKEVKTYDIDENFFNNI